MKLKLINDRVKELLCFKCKVRYDVQTIHTNILVTVATAQHHQPPQQPHQPPQPQSPTSSGNSLGLLQPFEDQEETEIDEEYWRKYPDLRPGSMSRELTEVEADSLHTELKEAVATFFGGSCSHSSSFEVRIL